MPIRLKNPPVGSDLGTVTASIPSLSLSDSATVSSYQLPTPDTTLPKIGDGYDTDTLTLSTTGLTGITAYEWRIVGGAVQGTGSTLSGSGLGGQWIECEVTCDQGTPVSPPMMVYSSTHMGMTMDASHIADEESIKAIIPHASATHIAGSDGDWTAPSTWVGGEVPGNGAIVLIPNGTTVTYDQNERYRLDHVRIEGVLDWATDQDTLMIVDTLFNGRGGQLLIGRIDTPMPVENTARIIIAGRDYTAGAYTPTDMDLTRDERLWGRGILNLGTRKMYGADKRAWTYAAPIDVFATQLTLFETPRNWQVGDKILIGGTQTVWTQGQPLSVQTEERTITGISGNVVTWDTSLTYPHKNQLAGSTRTDLYPVICLKESNNIKIESEAPDIPHQRGHTADMHHMSVLDLRNADHIELGRTHKQRSDPAGVTPETGQFKLYIEDVFPVDGVGYEATLNDTLRTFTMDFTDFLPVEGEDYWMKVSPTDADDSTFVADDYRVGSSSTLAWTAGASADGSDLAAGLAAEWATFISDNSLSTNVLNMTASGPLLTVTSNVTTSTDTIYVNLGKKSFFKTARADDNLQSRYPIHLHRMGFEPTVKPNVSECYVGGSPGWAIVHHDCMANFFNNVMYNFAGAGMVSESSNELGAWVGNVALDTSYEDGDALTSGVKVRETERGMAGDMGRFGYGFLMRGRAMRVVGNVACGCTWAYVFHHRQSGGLAPARLNSLIGLSRDYADLAGIGEPVHFSSNTVGSTRIEWRHYPIVHFADNESIACRDGFFVTKNLPDQQHDAGVRIKRFKSWACLHNGWEGEYVANYILENFDCVNGNGSAVGIGLGANMFQIFIKNSRVEGFPTGISIIGTEPNNELASLNYSTTNPRFGVFGTDIVDFSGSAITNSDFNSGDVPAFSTIYQEDDDLDGELFDFDLDPTWNFPLEGGTWDGTNSGNLTTSLSNSDGKKTDNLSTTARMAPHKELIKDVIMPTLNSQLRRYKRNFGWHSYDAGSGAAETMVIPFLISDRVTARPAIKTLMFRNTGSALDAEDGPGLIGTYTYSATPVTRADIVTTVAEGGSTVIDVLAGSAGGGGAGTYVLHRRHHIKPDHGELDIDYDTGEITYTPDRGFVGPDEWYMFVESQGQYATVRINVLVGAGGSVSTPVVDTDFELTGGSGNILVELFNKPSCGNRRITRVEYTTDGGTTRRRLTNFWIKDIHQIDVDSGGTALSAGSYDIQIRYWHDHEYQASAWSVASTAIVT